MSIRILVEKYPEIFSKEKYKKRLDQIENADAGDPGVSMEYYIDEIIGIEGYTYDDHIGKHKLTKEEEQKCKEYYKDSPYSDDFPKDYTLVDELREKGWIE